MCAICTVVIVEEFLYVILNVACRKIIFISVPEVLCMGANPMGLKKKNQSDEMFSCTLCNI